MSNYDDINIAVIQDKRSLNSANSSVLDAFIKDLRGDHNKPIQGELKPDPLGLGNLYSKEQVDTWLSQGYSVAEIRSGLAAKGTKFDYSGKMAELIDSLDTTLKTKDEE